MLGGDAQIRIVLITNIIGGVAVPQLCSCFTLRLAVTHGFVGLVGSIHRFSREFIGSLQLGDLLADLASRVRTKHPAMPNSRSRFGMTIR